LKRSTLPFSHPSRKTWADLLALFLSILGFIGSSLVTQDIFEGIPHIEDEIAYVWQAKALLEGHLTVPSPTDYQSFVVPFIVDYHGLRFGKYPPGWPSILATAIQLDVRPWINPILAGLGVWLTYLLGKKIFSQFVGLLAAGLTITSPFFLMNSGSLLSHPFGLVLSALFALGWLEAFWTDETIDNVSRGNKHWRYTLVSALALGVLVLTRPFTALAVALPLAIHGVYLFFRCGSRVRLRLLVFGLIGILFVGLYLLWQYSLTGDALLNPYTLWWPYDRLGFGLGIGRTASGNTLSLAWLNTSSSLLAGANDLFGWASLSWIFLPLGLWSARRNPKALLIGGVILSLVAAYMAYWVGASLFGPRYYYEGLYSLTLFTAAGIAWLAGWPSSLGEVFKRYYDWRKLRPLVVTFVLGFLLAINLTLYLPIRLHGMLGLYDIQRTDQTPFLAADVQSLVPALVVVHTPDWNEYGALIDLEDPELSTPFIFAWSSIPGIQAINRNDYPSRTVYDYYPAQPFQLIKESPPPE
jgi:hypothetical protein